MRATGSGAAYALLSEQRELETSPPRARFSDEPARAVRDRRALGNHAPGAGVLDDRPARRAFAGSASGGRKNPRLQPPEPGNETLSGGELRQPRRNRRRGEGQIGRASCRE